MEEKTRCLLCGAMSINNLYCLNCNEKLNNKNIREILNEDDILIKILTKNGCLACPLFQTEYCKIVDEHILCKNAEDEMNLCKKYYQKWFEYKNVQ